MKRVVRNKKNSGLLLVFLLAFVLSFFFLLGTRMISIEQTVLGVGLENNKIVKADLTTLDVPLSTSLILPKYNKGQYKLYIEIKDLNLEEVILSKDFKKVGDGFLLTSDIKIPLNSTLLLKVDLRDSTSLDLLDQKCYEIKIENGKTQDQKEKKSC